MEASGISWDTVARWKRSLIDREYQEITATFVAAGVTAPRILWSPGEQDLPLAMMRHVYRVWTGLRGTGTAPHHRQVDPLDLVPALGYVNILEAVEGTSDLRYRLFGSIAAKVSRFDMTGRLQSQHPASRYVADFALACSNACLERCEPLFTEREPARAERTVRWPRLVLPLRGDCGGAVRLLTVVVPLDAERNVIR